MAREFPGSKSKEKPKRCNFADQTNTIKLAVVLCLCIPCVYADTICSILFSLGHINTEKVNGVSGLVFPQRKICIFEKTERERMKIAGK